MKYLVFVSLCAGIASATFAHADEGERLRPFDMPPPPASLSEAENARVRGGEAVVRDIKGRTDGRRMVVFSVAAPPDVVWHVITDFPAYTRYVEQVKKIEVLKHEGDVTIARLTVAQMGFNLVYTLRHDYREAEHWGTWTIDDEYPTDLADSVGYWRVAPVADDPTRSLVEYSAQVKPKGWVPGFLLDMIRDKGLLSTADWVRAFSAAAHKTR